MYTEYTSNHISIKIYVGKVLLKDSNQHSVLGTSVMCPCEAESGRELCFLIKPVLHPRSLGMSPSNTTHRLPGKTQCFIIASANIDQHHLALSLKSKQACVPTVHFVFSAACRTTAGADLNRRSPPALWSRVDRVLLRAACDSRS